MKFALLFTTGLICSGFGFAQNPIEVVIDHGGLHCPFLGPKFAVEFNKHQGVDSTIVDTQNSIGYVYLADGVELTDEQIRDIVVNKVGYPLPEIKAINRNEGED